MKRVIRMATSARAPRPIRATGPKIEADASRNRKAFYVGASTNITTPWLVDLAGRYEDHLGFRRPVPPGACRLRSDFNDALRRARDGEQRPSRARTWARRTSQITKVHADCRGIDRGGELAGGQGPGRHGPAAGESRGTTASDSLSARHTRVPRGRRLLPDQGQRSAGPLRAASAMTSVIPPTSRDPNGTPLIGCAEADHRQSAGHRGHQDRSRAATTRSTTTPTSATPRTRGVELTLEIHAQHRQWRLRWNYAFSKAKTDVLSLAAIPQVLETLAQHHPAHSKRELGLCVIACRSTTRS